MENLANFADRLAHAIERRTRETGAKLEQKELATRVGVSASIVTQWLKNDVNTDNMKAKNVFALARFLRVRPEWLWDREGQMRDGDGIPRDVQQLIDQITDFLAANPGTPTATAVIGALRSHLELLILHAGYSNRSSGTLDLNAPRPPEE